MRGAPLFEALAAALALLLLALPIRGLTLRSRPKPVPAPVAGVARPNPVRLEVVATAESYEFEVSYLGRRIWSGTARRSPAYTQVELPLPKEGVELEVSARFPDSGLHALRLTLFTGDGAQVARSAWGSDTLDEVLTFQPGS
jgi:hypothetical protein